MNIVPFEYMDFTRPEKVWRLRQRLSDISTERLGILSRDVGIPQSIAKILALRGFADRDAIVDFLMPSLTKLPRPHLMKGMDKAVTLLLDALKYQKPVTVYGDFDADGVTATAVLSLFFSELGVVYSSYIPDRFTEGYGLNIDAVRKIHDRNMQQCNSAGVLLTADCGISDADAVATAQDLGFTVIITDHHKPPERLPEADAILNPLQSNCSFPCKNLAGVGVAFYLILGIRSELMTNGYWPEDKIPNLKSYLDLVAIGTVADQVPVTTCNRIIVKAGLEVMNHAGRIGLQKLLHNAKNTNSSVSTEDIAFCMAPRINAAGRIGSAHAAVELMTTNFAEEAQRIADELEEANCNRKNIEATIFAEAAAMITPQILADARTLVLYKDDWHQGVLGIVASRLCDQFFRPTILLTDAPQTDDCQSRKFVKGSGRSVEGIDIHTAVSSCREMLQRFGGHAGAVGLTLLKENIGAFKLQFDAMVGLQAEDFSSAPSLYIDMTTTLDELADPDFLDTYMLLAPFGSGNPEPVFSILSQKLSNPRLVGTNHLKFILMANGKLMHGIGFGFGGMVETVQNNLMDLVFTIRLNSYLGQEKWEINLTDLRLSSPG